MTSTQSYDNTHLRDSSTNSAKTRQLPLRAAGLNVHDAHDQPDQKPYEQHYSDQRAVLIKKIEEYPDLKIEPPYDDKKWVGHQCAVWAYRHPITRDHVESELLSTIAFEAALNRIAGIHDHFKCNLDQKNIANKLGVSVKSVQRTIKRIKDFDVITIERLRDDDRKRSMNFYILAG